MFKGLECVRNFFDDFAVFNKRYDYLGCLRVVLESVDVVKMGFNSDKCICGIAKGILLGYKVSADGVEVDFNKVKKILVRRESVNVTEVRSFVVVV